MRICVVHLLFVFAIGCILFTGCGGGMAQIENQASHVVEFVCFIDDVRQGKEMAKSKRKPMLQFFSVPDSAGSQRMLETTFRDEEIRRLADWLVCIHIDGVVHSELCGQLNISSFPTTILSDADGAEIIRLIGRQTPDQLAVQIHVLLQAMALRPQSISSSGNAAKWD